MRVFIAGAGTMGAGIAETFLAHGYEVYLFDTIEAAVESGKTRVKSSILKDLEKGNITEEEAQRRRDRFVATIEMEDAAQADLVVEAVFENMDIKQDILQALDEICPEDTLFTSNTSALSITEMASGLRHAPKMCGLHFFNPAPKTKVVEVVAGLETAPETLERVQEIATSIAKKSVAVEEYAGFIVNRLLFPQINEAIFMLMEGVATTEDIDQAMVLAVNMKEGPLQMADRLGNDHVLQVLENLHAETGDGRYRPCPLLRKMVRANLLGRKTGRGFYTYETCHEGKP